MTERQQNLVEFLKENYQLLDKSLLHLEFSFQKCRELNLQGSLSEAEMEALDAFASRFARTSDIFTQKVVITLLQLLQEDHPTFIDRMNFCEKINAISSASDMVEIRALRNAIAHEYRQANLIELYEKILENEPILNTSIVLCRQYAASKFPEI